MALAFLVLESVVRWAMRQRIMTGKIAKENRRFVYLSMAHIINSCCYSEYNWTKTHGFFAIMGGFMEHHDGGPPTVLDAKDVPQVTKRRTLEVEIQDRSKGGGLSKMFALVQTVWFILQCISRAIEGLPMTELEVATCAFAILNFATYILWWNKPLNVRWPVLLYPEDGKEQEEIGEEEGILNAVRRIWKALMQGLSDIPNEIYRPIADISGDGNGLNFHTI
jgi:hypothetical protein